MALYAFDGTRDDNRDEGTDAAGVAKSTNIWKFYSAYDGQTGGASRNLRTSTCLASGRGSARRPRRGRGVRRRLARSGQRRLRRAVRRVHQRRSHHRHHRFQPRRRDGARLRQQGCEARHPARATRSSSPNPKIRFLGLFDVVAAFGVANLGFAFAELNVGHHLDLPTNVEHCFHAMALDERRPSFVVTRVDGAYEVWFRGVHSDIGGGNENVGLNNITLRWMYRKAMLAGLPIQRASHQRRCVPPAGSDPAEFLQ